MKLAELRELVHRMTPGRWHARSRCISLQTRHIGNFAERADANTIAALRNHSEAMLDIVAAVDGVLATSDPDSELLAMRELRCARGLLEVVE